MSLRWMGGALAASLMMVAVGCAGDDGGTTDTPGETDSGVDAAQVYADNCQACHGADGGGTAAGANLNDRVPGLTEADVADIIRNGAGNMEGFSASAISDEELDALSAYVVETWGG